MATYDLTLVGNVIARAMLVYMTISLVVLGIQLFMCIYGLTVFLETPSSLRKGRLPYILLSFLLFVLLSISSTLNVNFLFRILFNATSPENFIFLRERTSDSLTFTSETLNLVVIFLGDGLLLYRCYVVWNGKRWIVIIPGLIYVTSVVFAILSLLPMLKDLSRADANLSYGSLFFFLSVAFNIIVTGLIACRLILARRYLSTMLPSATLSHYTGVVAILIESVVPLSIFGLGYAIILAVTKSGDPDLLKKEVANYVFSVLYYSFAALSPQMIIFRVTTGRSFAHNLPQSSDTEAPNELAFAHTNVGEKTTFTTGPTSQDIAPCSADNRGDIEEKV